MIDFRNGDLLKQPDIDIVAHQVNCKGAMNSGIAKQIREEFPDNYVNYRNYCILNDRDEKKLGGQLLVTLPEKDIDKPIIANLFSQGNYGYDGQQYTNYEYFEKCMVELYKYALRINKTTVGVPHRIGCVRGGADWSRIFEIMASVFSTDSAINLIICKYDKD